MANRYGRHDRGPMTAGERALLDAIIAAPDDDGPRLVHADWLQQQRADWQRARGELVVLQCQLEQSADDAARVTAVERERALFEEYAELWCAHLGFSDDLHDRTSDLWQLEFWRGFVASVTLWTGFLPVLAPKLFALEPVQELTLLDRVPHVLQHLHRARYLERLRALALHGWITAPELEALARSPHVVNLERLELRATAVADTSVLALSRSPSLARLRALVLQGTQHGPDVAVAIATSPQLELEELQLSTESPMSDAAVTALIESPRMARLRKLVVPVLGPAQHARLVARFGAGVVVA